MAKKQAKGSRKRRTPEERIRDLQLEIARLKEVQKARANRGRRQALMGAKALRKALPIAKQEQDEELERALAAALAALEPCVGKAAARGGTRIRRSPEDLAALKEQLLAFLKKNPGSGIGAMAEALGEPQKEIRGPLMALVEERQVEKKGETRNTRYSVRR